MKKITVFDNTLKRYRYAIKLAHLLKNKVSALLAIKHLASHRDPYVHFRKQQLIGAIHTNWYGTYKIDGKGPFPLTYTLKRIG